MGHPLLTLIPLVLIVVLLIVMLVRSGSAAKTRAEAHEAQSRDMLRMLERIAIALESRPK